MGPAWIVNASKSTKWRKAEIDGKTWMLAVRASMFPVSPPKNHFMASVHRRPASKYWHAFFRDSEGRLIDKSTRLKDRKPSPAGTRYFGNGCYVRSMLTTELQQDTHSGPVTLNPRWLRIPAAVKYSGLSRSKLYELLSEKRIKSICVKARKGGARGVRLLDRESIDSFMLAVPTDAASE